MHWFTGVVLFTMIWWTVLFAVLPIGTNPVADADPATGGWRGAPDRPRIGRKLLITTLVSAVLFLAALAVIQSDVLSFRTGLLAPAAE